MLDANGQFQRYVAPNPQALADRTAQDQAALAHPLPHGELLTEALALARALADQEREVQNLNNLATALQYLGRREEALALFAEALARAPGTPAWQHRDFIHHHRGRCLVELDRIAEARQDFATALDLRLAKGDALYIASSRRALAALGD